MLQVHHLPLQLVLHHIHQSQLIGQVLREEEGQRRSDFLTIPLGAGRSSPAAMLERPTSAPQRTQEGLSRWSSKRKVGGFFPFRLFWWTLQSKLLKPLTWLGVLVSPALRAVKHMAFKVTLTSKTVVNSL